MSEAVDSPSGAAVDPLTALRSADARPLHQQWRERFHELLRSPEARRYASGLGGLVVVVLVGQWLLRASEPPIEDSLPMAVPEAVVPTAEIRVGAATPPEPAAAVSDAQHEPSPVVVHVAGAVERPGLITGDDAWRVADAISAAGGAAADADLDRVNLAAPVRDGERIFVPEVDGMVPVVVAGSSSGEGEGGLPAPTGPIDVNAADGAALERLPGIGPVTAAAILSHRDEHGPFATVDSLVAVRGIGPATVDSLRDHVVVG